MSQSLDATRTQDAIDDIRQRIEEHRARLARMIVQGAPTQSAEDQLCELEQRLARLTGYQRFMHT